MVSILKAAGVISGSFLLCLGLSSMTQAGNAAPAAGEMNADQSDRRQGGQGAGKKHMSDEMTGGQSKDGKMIKGEVLRLKALTILSRDKMGKVVRLHTDQSTQNIESFKQGDRIEAKVTDENHVLSIRSARGTDTGSGNQSGRDSLHETDADHGK